MQLRCVDHGRLLFRRRRKQLCVRRLVLRVQHYLVLASYIFSTDCSMHQLRRTWVIYLRGLLVRVVRVFLCRGAR